MGQMIFLQEPPFVHGQQASYDASAYQAVHTVRFELTDLFWGRNDDKSLRQTARSQATLRRISPFSDSEGLSPYGFHSNLYLLVEVLMRITAILMQHASNGQTN